MFDSSQRDQILNVLLEEGPPGGGTRSHYAPVLRVTGQSVTHQVYQPIAGLADAAMHSPFKRDEAGSIPASRTNIHSKVRKQRRFIQQDQDRAF